MKNLLTALAFFLVSLNSQGQAPPNHDVFFAELSALPWHTALSDDGTGDWTANWVFDGAVATVENTPRGMIITSGPEAGNDDHHAVLWTREMYSGDVKIEFDFTRLDDSKANAVHIVYVQATGSGEPGFDRDIHLWGDKRTSPAMRMYFNHINTYHVSYATDGLEPAPESQRYIRARRYMPSAGKGLDGTALSPEYLDVEMFKKDVPYHITIIRRGTDLYFKADGAGRSQLFWFDLSSHPEITEGYIGLRQMFTRRALYSGLTISTLPDERHCISCAN